MVERQADLSPEEGFWVCQEAWEGLEWVHTDNSNKNVLFVVNILLPVHGDFVPQIVVAK